jgi:hypothetical protein
MDSISIGGSLSLSLILLELGFSKTYAADRLV